MKRNNVVFGLMVLTLVIAASCKNPFFPDKPEKPEKIEPPSVPAVIAFSGFGDEEIELDAAGGDVVSRGATLTVTINGDYASYRWFVDGTVHSGENTDSFTITIPDNWPIGEHKIMAVVTAEGAPDVPCSKQLTFQVEF